MAATPAGEALEPLPHALLAARRRAATASAPPPPSSSSSSAGIHHHSAGRYGHEGGGGGAVAGDGAPAGSISSVAKSLLPARRRLRLDPPNKLYFPCECARGIRGLGSSASWFNCGMRS